jgi:hypothetical protein
MANLVTMAVKGKSPASVLQPLSTHTIVIIIIIIILPLLLSSQGQITTGDQSVSPSWFRGPSGSHDRILISV